MTLRSLAVTAALDSPPLLISFPLETVCEPSTCEVAERELSATVEVLAEAEVEPLNEDEVLAEVEVEDETLALVLADVEALTDSDALVEADVEALVEAEIDTLTDRVSC